MVHKFTVSCAPYRFSIQAIEFLELCDGIQSINDRFKQLQMNDKF